MSASVKLVFHPPGDALKKPAQGLAVFSVRTSVNDDLIKESGEPGRTRTDDHLIKSQVLYHLSYGLVGRV